MDFAQRERKSSSASVKLYANKKIETESINSVSIFYSTCIKRCVIL